MKPGGHGPPGFLLAGRRQSAKLVGQIGKMRMRSGQVVVCLVGLVLAVPGRGAAQGGGAEAAAERQAGMKSADDALGVIKHAIDTGADGETAGLYARAIADWARKMPTLFPRNSGRGAGVKTAALDEIWTEPDEFNRRLARLMNEASALARALRGTDRPAVAAAYAETADACRSCHIRFRADF